MSNEYVGGLDVNLDIPDIANPDVGFNIRNPFELWFEESLPASLYQYISGNTKQKQAIEARKKIKELDPKSKESPRSGEDANVVTKTLPGEFVSNEAAARVAVVLDVPPVTTSLAWNDPVLPTM